MVSLAAGGRWLAIAVLGPITIFAIGVLAVGVVASDWPELGDIGGSEVYPSLSLALSWTATTFLHGFGSARTLREIRTTHVVRYRCALRGAAAGCG